MSIDEDKVSPDIGLPDPDSDPVHSRLRAALGETGRSFAPRPGWEERVWARIDGEAKATATGSAPRARWQLFSGAAVLAAAAVALLVWHPWRGSAAVSPDTARGSQIAMASPPFTIRQGAEVMRGTTAAPGHTLVVQHPVSNAVVWVYFEDALHFEGGARFELVLDRPGTYHVVSTSGPAPARAPATLDAALAALVTAGTEHRRDTVEVR